MSLQYAQPLPDKGPEDHQKLTGERVEEATSHLYKYKEATPQESIKEVAALFENVKKNIKKCATWPKTNDNTKNQNSKTII